jgi:hypothetical protein
MQDQNQSLQPQSHALSVSKTASLQVSAPILAAELKLTALNAKTDLDEFLVTEFSRALLDLPAEAIQASFRAWRNISQFFPAICDIRQGALVYMRTQAEIREEQERAKRRKDEEQARSTGELVDFADIKQRLADIAAKVEMPEPRKMRFSAAVTTREIPPALPLTKEQIEARRAAEQGEIERYKAQGE